MKTTIRNSTIALALLVLSGAVGLAQTAATPTTEPDRAVVPLTDPAKPAFVEASVMRGSITVKAYAGKDVIVEARVREKALRGDSAWGVAGPAIAGDLSKDIAKSVGKSFRVAGFDSGEQAKRNTEGMKKLSVASTGLDVEEENNRVSIDTQGWKYATDLVIQVPAASSLKLDSVQDGEIVVEGVSGEIEVDCVNGPVTLRNVSGTAVVESVNGAIEASFARLGDKPMSFTTMNGDIDVTLPALVKATLKLKSEQGDVYSDFDVALKQVPVKTTDSGSEKGRYRVSFEKQMQGTINGGGPEISFSTFNGSIFLRKGK